MKRISIELTRAQWLMILRAVDNGCGAGDGEVLCGLFSTLGERKRFSSAFWAINEAVGASYVIPTGSDLLESSWSQS